MCTSAVTDDPELRMLAVPRPTVVRGICCWVETKLKSQFRRSGFIGTGAPAAAVPAPIVTAEVSAEADTTVTAVADIPKRLSPRICPNHFYATMFPNRDIDRICAVKP